MINSPQAPYPLRLLDPWRTSGSGPRRVLVITDEPDRWCSGAASIGVEWGRDGRGVVLRGELEALLALARLLEGSAGSRELAAASSVLSRPPRSLELRGHRWRLGMKTRLLGVINTTPDSFSGDGVGASADRALDRAAAMVREGVDAIDVGGESSRPGHSPVRADEEMERAVPAISRIAAALPVPVFVDTWKAPVAEEALRAGASGVNDIWGLRRDPEMAGVVARHGAAVVLMHNQQGAEYRDVLGEVLGGLAESLRLAHLAAIPKASVILDPGIGFGKTPAQSLEVLAHLEQLTVFGRPLLVGTSRKSVIGWLLKNRPVSERLLGTAASVAWASWMGAEIVRVHDVAEMRDILLVADRLRAEAERPPRSR